MARKNHLIAWLLLLSLGCTSSRARLASLLGDSSSSSQVADSDRKQEGSVPAGSQHESRFRPGPDDAVRAGKAEVSASPAIELPSIR